VRPVLQVAAELAHGAASKRQLISSSSSSTALGRLCVAGPPLFGLLLLIGAYKAGRHHLKEEEIEPNPKGESRAHHHHLAHHR